jgi:phage gpG-like protein
MTLPRGLTPGPGESVVELSLSFSGSRDISRRLKALDGALANLTPAWPEVDAVFRIIVAEQFDSEGAHGGVPFAPLAPSTQAERKRQGYLPTFPILQRTHRLKDSLTRVTADTITEHWPQRYAIGTRVPYYVYHQSQAPRTRLPRRAPVQLTSDDKNALMRPVRNWLRGQAAHSMRARMALVDSFQRDG